MTLREFISDRDRRERLASTCETSGDYLQQIGWGYRRPSPELAKRIEAASREIGPEAVSAVELLFAERPTERRRYVRRAPAPTRPAGLARAKALKEVSL